MASGTANVPEEAMEKATEKATEKVMEKATEKAMEKVTTQKHAEKQDKNEGMIITIGQKRFRLVEVDEQKTRDETIDKVLEIPKPKNVKLGPCQVPGLPQCVSSQEF